MGKGSGIAILAAGLGLSIWQDAVAKKEMREEVQETFKEQSKNFATKEDVAKALQEAKRYTDDRVSPFEEFMKGKK